MFGRASPVFGRVIMWKMGGGLRKNRPFITFYKLVQR